MTNEITMYISCINMCVIMLNKNFKNHEFSCLKCLTNPSIHSTKFFEKVYLKVVSTLEMYRKMISNFFINY